MDRFKGYLKDAFLYFMFTSYVVRKAQPKQVFKQLGGRIILLSAYHMEKHLILLN